MCFLMVFRHFYEGSDNRYDRPIFDNFGPSIPRRAASPVKLQKRWQIFPDVLRHWSTFWYWYHRRESYTLRKQASDYTWWPIIDGLLYFVQEFSLFQNNSASLQNICEQVITNFNSLSIDNKFSSMMSCQEPNH